MVSRMKDSTAEHILTETIEKGRRTLPATFLSRIDSTSEHTYSKVFKESNIVFPIQNRYEFSEKYRRTVPDT